VSGGRLVVDTSALAAIALREPEFERLLDAIAAADEALMSAGSLQEFLLVMAGREVRGHGAEARLGDVVGDSRDLVRHLGIRVVEVTDALAVLGALGTATFRAGPARLNFGDGFAYALARALSCPLLFVGSDFTSTDVAVASV
jgi:ribonuclease VapC